MSGFGREYKSAAYNDLLRGRALEFTTLPLLCKTSSCVESRLCLLCLVQVGTSVDLIEQSLPLGSSFRGLSVNTDIGGSEVSEECPLDSRTMTKRDPRTWSEDLGIFEM